MIGRFAAPGPVPTLRPEIAAGMVLVGVMSGMVALGAGFLWLGMTGLVLIGLGVGFTGGLRHRVVAAALIWLVATALAIVGAAFGRIGFEITAPVVVSAIFVALGQIVGVVTAVVSARYMVITRDVN
ncbi:hypothetical protein [Aquisalimonas sp.]|uniref:hypothetical protein n=1 Tax=Aquisalimonas sp. TaxID=1872621 RepID=UPI0025C2EA91|nr:hypothetical protein [Aquisalimonas sp.]